MKRFLLLLSLAGAIALHMLTYSNNNDDVSIAAHAATRTSTSSLTSLFKESLGKYAFDCGLLSNKFFSTRLKSLTGEDNFKLMFESKYELSPIEYSKGFYHFWGMVKYEDFEYEIAYDPANDALSVCITDELGPQYIFENSKSDHNFWH